MKAEDAGLNHRPLHELIKQTLDTGNLHQASELPSGHNLNDWLAIHAIEFYEEVNVMFSAVNEFCTLTRCPTMSAGNNTEYLWVEPDQAPQSVPAAHYVDSLMIWVESLLDNENIFPNDDQHEFPLNFVMIVKAIFKRLFRVYAHIYHAHIEQVAELQLDAHFNTSFLHFVIFAEKFALIPSVELSPLNALIRKMLRTYKLTLNGDS